MKKNIIRKRIEKIVLLLLFIPSSIYIIYDLEENWKYNKENYKREKEAFKLKSFNELLKVTTLLSYIPKRYDKEKEITQLSYQEKLDPLVVFTLQEKLRADYFLFERNDTNLLILDNKNKNVLKAYETVELDNFLKEYNLPSKFSDVKGYRSGDKYYFIEPSLRDNIYYILTINDSFFQLDVEDKRFGKWFLVYDGKVINNKDEEENLKILGKLEERKIRKKNIEVYFKDAKVPMDMSELSFLKELFVYLLLNIIFVFTIMKVLIKVAYEPIKKIVDRIAPEEEKEGLIESINNVYEGLKAENELLKEANSKTTEYLRKKSLVDYFKGLNKFENVDHPMKNSKFDYRVFVGNVEINEYSDEQVISFKQDMDRKMKIYNGIFLLIDRGIIALIIRSDKINTKDLKNIFDEFHTKYDLEIMGFLSEKNFKIKDLYNKSDFFIKYLDYKFKLKEKVIITEKDIVENIKDYYYPIRIEQKIMSRIMDKKRNVIVKLYEEIYEENFEKRRISSHKFEKLKILITNTFRRIQEDVPNEKRVEEKKYIEIIDSKNKEELKSAINEAIESLFNILPEPKTDGNDLIKEKIDDFIRTNYAKEISLLDFAEYMGVTLQYASNLYKKVKNETFNKSLRKYRIDKSLELYKKDRGLKIKDLSILVGYSNTMTFINNFKKEKGMPPGKYLTDNQ